MRRVLVLEGSDTLRRELLLGLRDHGVDAEGVTRAGEVSAALASGHAAVLVHGPGGGELAAALAAVTEASPAVPVVALVDGDVARGLAAMREGAADFVTVGEGIARLATALAKADARLVVTVTRAESGAPARPADGPADAPPPVLVGSSPAIAAVLVMVRKLAGVRAGVLVGGESGTGKELIARALHDQSPWRAGAFVAINCGAIPAGLIESELFGHVRGAFTDAVRDKRGLFEAAHQGTLFLDEIADLPLALQPKLLRVLQDGVMRRIGDVQDVRVEVRVVAATARDLAAEVRAGRFREDLYYRLAALLIQIPPLRDRRGDIPQLSAHFLARARAKLGRAVEGIDADAARALAAHTWPGNVRELENTIERAAVLCTGDRIDLASLPERLLPPEMVSAVRGEDGAAGDPSDEGGKPGGADGDLSIKRASRRFEQDLIRRALVATGGNRTRAAELLEISHRALLYKIKEYEIVVSRQTRAASRKS